MSLSSLLSNVFGLRLQLLDSGPHTPKDVSKLSPTEKFLWQMRQRDIAVELRKYNFWPSLGKRLHLVVNKLQEIDLLIRGMLRIIRRTYPSTVRNQLSTEFTMKSPKNSVVYIRPIYSPSVEAPNDSTPRTDGVRAENIQPRSSILELRNSSPPVSAVVRD